MASGIVVIHKSFWEFSHNEMKMFSIQVNFLKLDQQISQKIDDTLKKSKISFDLLPSFLQVQDNLFIEHYETSTQPVDRKKTSLEMYDFTKEFFDQFFMTEVLLLQESEIKCACVTTCKYDANGRSISTWHDNPFLNLYIYKVEFSL